MINALNNTATTNRRNLLLATAGAGMAILFSACGGSETDQPTADQIATPVAAVEATPVDTTPADSAPVEQVATPVAPTEAITPVEVAADTLISDEAITEIAETIDATPARPEQLIPASSPDLPCESYTEATELPLVACSRGELVTEFQSWAAYVDPDFVVDGYFGEATLDAVTNFQAMYGLEPTGVIDEALMAAIHGDHDESGHPWNDEEGDDDSWIVDDEQYDATITHAGADEEGC